MLVQFSADDRRDLEPSPIPAEDVLRGDPVARSLTVAELGDGMSVWLWDCTPGRFRWHFRYGDEVVHIVDGAVTVTDQEGGVVRLGPGDVAAFSADTWAIWDVEQHVRKVAVTRGLPGDPLSRVARWVRRTAKRLLRR